MDKKKKIIVPIDFSNESKCGLDLAIKVANEMQADVEMVHVIKASEDLFASAEKEHRREADKAFRQIIEEYKHHLNENCQLRHIIHKGRIHREVVNHAKYNAASMIVGSTHGASGFEELFIGSNAHRILAETDLPAMFIRNGIAPKRFDRIVLPIDDTLETRQKVPFTAELARNFDAEIIVQAITSTNNAQMKTRVKAYKDQVADFLDKEKIKYSVREDSGNIVDNILRCGRECDADLIAVMAEEERTLSEYILGSNTQELIRKANLPVLCVHQREIYKISDLFRVDP